MQVVTDSVGRLLWLSLALPGRAHDGTVACTTWLFALANDWASPAVPRLVQHRLVTVGSHLRSGRVPRKAGVRARIRWEAALYP
ncbi:hypothetical protein GCM10010350_79100 [Streptomyces galilaeus]|nr:hypothetical protein GCM10010350_79100 [Streptomyces galilaeus]